MTERPPQQQASAAPVSGLQRSVQCIAAAAACTPLIVTPGLFHPFVSGKVIAFRSLALLVSAIVVAGWALGDRRLRPRLTPITGAILFMWLTLALATVTALDVPRALWDTPSRMLGSVSLIAFGAYTIALATALRGWHAWRPVLRVTLAAASAVSLVAIVQKLGWSPVGGPLGDRATSTLGNAAYLSAYGAFTAFIGWMVAMKEHRVIGRMLAGGAALLGLSAVWLGESRAALLAVAAGAVVMAIAYRRTLECGDGRRRRFDRAALACLLVVAGAWATAHTQFGARIPLIRRLAPTRSTVGSADVRLETWNAALLAARERPLLGYGHNGFYHAFDSHYSPRVLAIDETATFADDAHDVALNALAERGVPGLLAYFALLGATLLTLVRSYERGAIDVHVAAAGAGWCTAWFVNGLFAFDDVGAHVCTYTFLAVIDGVGRAPVAVEADAPRRGRALVIAACVGTAVIAFVEVPVVRSYAAAADALRAVQGGAPDAPDRMRALRAASSPLTTALRGEVALAVGAAADRWATDRSRDVAAEVLALAYDDALAAHEHAPLDVRLALIRAQLARVQTAYLDDRSNLEDAETATRDALEIAPARQDLKFALSTLRQMQGDVTAAVHWAEDAYASEPTAGESVWRLALLYRSVGREPEARALVRSAQENRVRIPRAGYPIVEQLQLLGE